MLEPKGEGWGSKQWGGSSSFHLSSLLLSFFLLSFPLFLLLILSFFLMQYILPFLITRDTYFTLKKKKKKTLTRRKEGKNMLDASKKKVSLYITKRKVKRKKTFTKVQVKRKTCPKRCITVLTLSFGNTGGVFKFPGPQDIGPKYNYCYNIAKRQC